MNTMMMLMIIMSTLLMTFNHPLSMGFTLIMQTMLMALIMGYLMKSFFFSYIIIIIMLSGVLVLFIYMSSVASNEKFNMSYKNLLYVIIWSMAMYYIMYYMMYMYKIPLNNNLNMNDNISLIKLFNSMTSQITMMMVLYLLLTMIVVSNNAKVYEGPLRMKK
uniref:NADH dehydrogenase subunit 6 n=1 Tax=Dalsira scabrata TaxID=2021946 RepID=A0A343ISG2_9HEMI|nr:NADH dehydrogenase subunit 6 [Dalsira scabrata]AST10187.1 NADH dehydrogenase subunit 6 [Dalsira scabrata]